MFVFFLLTLGLFSNMVNPLQAQEGMPEPDGNGRDAAEIRAALREAFLADQGPAADSQAQAATPCAGGFAGSYPCKNVDLLAFMPLNSIGGGNANDIWGWTDPLNGKEYAIMGRTSGTSFVDISDPVNPVYLGSLPPHTANSDWRDIKVYANHAYIVSEAAGHGMQVFDLTRLRNVSSPPVTLTEDAHYNGVSNTHNIAINEQTGFAYLVGSNTCSGGLHMVDISSPKSPQFAGCYSGDGYTHDTQCVIYNGPDLTHIGHEICFSANEDTVTIVDVTDKSSPIQLSRTTYTGHRYTHQAWLSEDQTILFVNDELDEQYYGHNTRTYIWDVTDLDSLPAPKPYTASTPAIDHNHYVRGHLLYQTNYRAGLRILDTTDAANGNLSEVGYFDTYPANDNPSYNGTWSSYVYFPSGVVVLSSIGEGLFIVKPNMAADFRLEAPAELSVCKPSSTNAVIDVEGLYGYSAGVTISGASVPAGTTVSFSSNPVTPSGSSTMTVSNSSTSAGDYLLKISAGDGSIGQDEYLKLNVIDQQPALPILQTPANNATGQAAIPTLAWQASSGAASYDLEIAYDPQFKFMVEAVQGLESNSYQPVLKLAGRTYWRVRAHNACGTTAFSAVRVFDTAAASCNLFASSDVPKLIAATGTPTISSTVDIPVYGVVTDVNVRDLQGTHTYIQDLQFSLTSPEGTETQIMAQSCGAQDNFDLNLDDEASPGAWPCPPTGGGTYRPSTPLANFDGQEGGGSWKLTVDDLGDNDGGWLKGWSLEICTAAESQVVPINQGWNLISSSIDPGNPTMSPMLEGINNELVLIKDGDGRVKWPQFNVDQIGTWQWANGYAIYLNSAAELTVNGHKIDPDKETAELNQGWNLVGYWRSSPMSVSTALGSISAQLELVKNDLGQVYWPSQGITTSLVTMEPGAGYQVFLNQDGVLVYPAN